MLSFHDLGVGFKRNAGIIALQSEGLTHAESLIQTEYNINCLNWVVGHMAVYRDTILAWLGQDAVLGEAGDRYRRESDPIRGEGEGVVPFERLLDLIRAGQAQLDEAFESLPEERGSESVMSNGRQTTLAKALFFAYFHDSYHVGQTDLLRQVAGRNDHVI
jgi:uncharacterized damage-inducible protein DinB